MFQGFSRLNVSQFSMICFPSNNLNFCLKGSLLGFVSMAFRSFRGLLWNGRQLTDTDAARWGCFLTVLESWNIFSGRKFDPQNLPQAQSISEALKGSREVLYTQSILPSTPTRRKCLGHPTPSLVQMPIAVEPSLGQEVFSVSHQVRSESSGSVG